MIEHQAGAILIGGVEGTSLTSEERRFFSSAQISGITLFRYNVPEKYRDTALLVRDVQRTGVGTLPSLVIAIDQEGGRVNRFRTEIAPDFPNQGPALKLAGGLSDAAALRSIAEYAIQLANALKHLGINVNFAPVLDIDTEPTNIAIGDRCFGKDVDSVAKRAGVFLGAMQGAGVLGCLKHFPGQGDAKVDTHAGRGIIDLTRRELDERELAPFLGLINHASMVMISHCIYPALDDREASLSPKVMKDLLRRDMGFRGVVVSDDMIMGAIAQDDRGWAEAIVDAVQQGADMILVCRHLEKMRKAHEALTVAAKKSPAFARRLDEAAARVLALRTRLTV